jgi:Sensors of blue-light using FAD
MGHRCSYATAHDFSRQHAQRCYLVIAHASVIQLIKEPPAMSLAQLIYVSQPFGYDSVGLFNILSASRRCNERDGLTGALICRADIYLQLLEGPEDKVAATFSRIKADDRHLEVQTLVSERIEQRLFPLWSMHHDPAHTWLWTQAEVDAGVLHNAAPADILNIFKRIKPE